ncbi:MAG: hypothetical protein MSH53_05070 [Solobacterium sp.]|nr:hypothetical protein [Solobacterium sp.]
MEVNTFKEALSKDIESVGYHLYSLTYKKKDNILEVLIDESLDLDGISRLSELISGFMDKYDKDFDEYLLDVSCAGCERRIRNEDELRRAAGEYVHIKTREFEEDGYLKSFENGKVTVEYMDKTRKKAVTVNYDDIKMIRYAVKF